ncbi:protein ALP1-like [Tripterygium wilfordii]|uniref:protein ALP1-like n=1 Tax=Tripterygium wilfordii TaxID=458696 RepID=UPI0018F81309|nr:protein ALP1-like [Tripterygium wilfordii]
MVKLTWDSSSKFFSVEEVVVSVETMLVVVHLLSVVVAFIEVEDEDEPRALVGSRKRKLATQHMVCPSASLTRYTTLTPPAIPEAPTFSIPYTPIDMESRKLAALISSLVSQLLLLLISPSSAPISSNSHFNAGDFKSNANIFALVHHFLSSQEIATSLSLLAISRKRKRTHLNEPDSESTSEDGDERFLHGLTRNPDSFKSCFKMTSSTFEWLSGLLEPLLDCRDPVGLRLNLPPEIRLGIGLFRLATGANYGDIASRFGVSVEAARFCSKQLCRVLCTNFRFWVAFPSHHELESVSTGFENLSGLPNCCGVIDCTRFKIARENDSDYGIAVQIVADSSSRILSIAAGFRGDKGDSRVLKSSTLCKDIEAGNLLNSNPVHVNGVAVNKYLIGDGGYPFLPWLIVPFVDVVPGSSEEKFNAAHTLMRIPVLRAIASLRNWAVLNEPIQEEFRTAVAFVGACSILHNVMLVREEDSALFDGLEDYSVFDQGSQYYRDHTSEDNAIEKNASIIRNALASRVSVFRESNEDPCSPGSSDPVQTPC